MKAYVGGHAERATAASTGCSTTPASTAPSRPPGNTAKKNSSRSHSVNLKGVFLGLRHVLPVMLNQGSGSIVNTASIGGERGLAGACAYNASKHGVVGLSAHRRRGGNRQQGRAREQRDARRGRDRAAGIHAGDHVQRRRGTGQEDPSARWRRWNASAGRWKSARWLPSCSRMPRASSPARHGPSMAARSAPSATEIRTTKKDPGER